MMTDEERRKARYESHKRWRKANPDKVRAQKRRHYAKHLEQMRKYHREWQRKNPEKVAAIRLKYHEKIMRRYERLKRLGVDATEEDYKLI